jgi:hypothetical protein
LYEKLVLALHVRRHLFLCLHCNFHNQKNNNFRILGGEKKIAEIKKLKATNEKGKRNILRTSHVDLGETMPVLGLTQYFFGLVVFTC